MNKKEQAIKFRKLGWSYNKINSKLGVPKGTLSYWFKDLVFSSHIKEVNVENSKKKWAANITKYNKNRSVLARKRWSDIQSESVIGANKFAKDPLFLAGVFLYWAEGYKRGNWNVIFTNSDPEINRIMMRFFINVCNVPKEKIKAQIQVHEVEQVEKSVKYWSKCTNIHINNFSKTTIQKRISKKVVNNRLPYGTLRIKINDVLLVNKIKGWITWVSNNIGV